jgi:hypothetical protein
MLRPPQRSWAWPLAIRPMSTPSTLMRLPVGGHAHQVAGVGAGHGGAAGEPAAVGQEQLVDGHLQVGERGAERGDLLLERLDALEAFAVLGVAGGDVRGNAYVKAFAPPGPASRHRAADHRGSRRPDR